MGSPTKETITPSIHLLSTENEEGLLLNLEGSSIISQDVFTSKDVKENLTMFQKCIWINHAGEFIILHTCIQN